jgi:putative zinc finger/helix-turn-helix YgiT family protein
MARAKRTKDRPFPWRCGSCDEKEVYRTPTAYTTTVKYEGRAYEVEIPDLELPKCRKCGEIVFDNHAGHQINRVLRQQLGLLQPDQIRAGRNELGMSQREFAARLGVAEESVSRWETDALIQSRAVDRQIRVFFEFPEVREALGKFERGYSLGEAVKTEPAPSSGTNTMADEYGRGISQDALKQAFPDFVSMVSEAAGDRWNRTQQTKTFDWTSFWSERKSFLAAVATYAISAPTDEADCLAQMFSSWARRPGSRQRKRWFAVYADPSSPMADLISQQLARLTQDLEDIPERSAAPLLDNFARILDVFLERR